MGRTLKAITLSVVICFILNPSPLLAQETMYQKAAYVAKVPWKILKINLADQVTLLAPDDASEIQLTVQCSSTLLSVGDYLKFTLRPAGRNTNLNIEQYLEAKRTTGGEWLKMRGSATLRDASNKFTGWKQAGKEWWRRTMEKFQNR